MEIINTEKTQKKQFTYFGEGKEFAIIYFKNILLTIFTLGLYYPWAKTERLKYHYQSTELGGARFSFTGTGKEIFKGFIKVYGIFFALYFAVIIGSQTKNLTVTIISLVAFYLFMFLMIPLAIHGAARYRASRSSWKGIHFKYVGKKAELFKKFTKGLFLTIITFGIYGAWLSVDIRKYVLNNLKFGNLEFDFKGEGKTLFWITLKFFILFYLTLGIYTFWYYKDILNFYAKNTEITQNGEKVKFGFNATIGDIFELVIVNGLLTIFTLGLATPWVIIRTFNFMFKFLHIEEGLDTTAIEQSNIDEYRDASGDDFLDFLDFDFI